VTRGRSTIILVIILALIGAGVARSVADRVRARTVAATGAANASSLSRMNSFALALLLGGLRGPLVMVLWTSSEAQKSERNLQDFDTKVEWIRLLQPEFDSVHIFQVWNKAYNISVQMASLGNKYITILDAIEYAMKVDRERPGNINVLQAIGGIYFDKLGNSTEKSYYMRKVREETLPHAPKQRLKPGDSGWRRIELDPMLDAKGDLLPELITPRVPTPRPATKDWPQDQAWNDGSELPFLVEFQPFPYGISPRALGYNYYKRCQYLLRVNGQSHAQLSDLVIDSRPALSLKYWAEEEWERGRRNELELFGLAAPSERLDMELPAAEIPLKTPLSAERAGAMKEALFSLNRAATVGEVAMREYLAHLSRYSNNAGIYQSHMDGLTGMIHLVRGDHDFLRAMSADGPDRDALLASAQEHYQKARRAYALVMLNYYVNDDDRARLSSPPVSRSELAGLPDEKLFAMLDNLRKDMGVSGALHGEDLIEYNTYIARAERRLRTIESARVTS
jgi:hypothetical protein